MGSKRDGLADVLEPTLRDTSPQARHHFTQADQVNQLVGASEAEPDRRAAIRSAPRHTTPIWPGRLMFDHRSVCRVEHSQVGVPPVSWTPNPLGEWRTRCQEQDELIHPSFASR